MISIENCVYPSDGQWEAVVRGVRNPYASHAKSDSKWKKITVMGEECNDSFFAIGENDLTLMKRLANAGDDHGKFLRMLPVIADITAPLHLWKQLDTYKVGTVANSYSTMHSIMNKVFTIDDFSWEHTPEIVQEQLLQHLNLLRTQYLSEDGGLEREEIWNELIEFLPESYNQTRTWSANYQVLKHIYHARKGHKLKDWQIFRTWVESIPYSELITGKES